MTNSAVIADSSGLISLISETDYNHGKALKLSQALEDTKTNIIVPSDVFTETINITGKKFGHETALKVAKILYQTQTFLVEESNQEIRDQALDLFAQQTNSTSFTDCIVMVTATEYNTKKIFGFDSVFSKNGFINN